MRTRITAYRVDETAYCDLPRFEDALDKKLVLDQGDNKITHISVSSFPSLLFTAVKLIKDDRGFESVAHIERIGVLYGICRLTEHETVKGILKNNMELSYSEDAEVLRSLDIITKINYSTPSRCDSTCISCLEWCKNWIASTSWAVGLSQSQLCIYSLIYALCRYDLKNKLVMKELKQENEHFMRYLEKKRG